MSEKKLACPHCGATDRLISVERASIGYPATFTSAGPEYTGEEYETYDDGTQFDDEISCRGCGAFEMTLAELVPAS